MKGFYTFKEMGSEGFLNISPSYQTFNVSMDQINVKTLLSNVNFFLISTIKITFEKIL